MSNTELTLPALLRHQATTQGDTLAYSFMDGAVLGTGHPERLTWNQLYRRVLSLAEELRRNATPGDRVAILAPQGLDYVVAFFAALQAGLIAVPLSVPMAGVHDQRVESALEDSTPSILLTTSAAVTDVNKYATARGGRIAPTVIEVDIIDVDVLRPLDETDDSRHGPAYLQYTSGSTRTAAGVIVSHRNVTSNIEQAGRDYFGAFGGTVPLETTIVSWLPFFHDMGLIMGVCAPVVTGCQAVLTSPLAFLSKPASWMQLMAQNPLCLSGAPNFAFELAVRRTSDADMEGLDLSHVHGILSGAERVHHGTVKRFIDRFGKFGLTEQAIRPSYGLAEATLFVSTTPSSDEPTIISVDRDELNAGRFVPVPDDSPGAVAQAGAGKVGVGEWAAIVDYDTASELPDGQIGEIWISGQNMGTGYWGKPEETVATFQNTLKSRTSPSHAEGAADDATWVRTGDLGAYHEGELYITGRTKDLVIIDGRNHYPQDLEYSAQESTKAVRTGFVAAFSVPANQLPDEVFADAHAGIKRNPDDSSEQLVIVAERAAGSHKLELGPVVDDIRAAIAVRHGVTVRDVLLTPAGAIPRTSSGKIGRRACRSAYLDGSLRSGKVANAFPDESD